METITGICSLSSPTLFFKSSQNIKPSGLFLLHGRDQPIRRFREISLRGSNSRLNSKWAKSVGDKHRRRSEIKSALCYDKPIPEEIIEKPIGLSMEERVIGDKPRCTDCEAKGAVLCATCSGSGLYIDSIMESQGIIVKVKCLGCGGIGNIMCTECGGRGHV